MIKNPFIGAGLAVLYILAISSFLQFGTRALFGNVSEFFAPIIMLSLLVLSVATMAYLFFYQPVKSLTEGDAAGAASYFLRTLGTFALLTAIIIASIALFAPRSQEVPAVDPIFTEED